MRWLLQKNVDVEPKEDATTEIKTEKEDAEMVDEEEIERLEEKVEAAFTEQKKLFILIFRNFIAQLSEHIQSCEAKGKSFKNQWFRWCIGRLQQVFFEVSHPVVLEKPLLNISSSHSTTSALSTLLVQVRKESAGFRTQHH